MSLINSLTSGKNTPTLSPLQSPPPSAIARHPARAQLCLFAAGRREGKGVGGSAVALARTRQSAQLAAQITTEGQVPGIWVVTH